MPTFGDLLQLYITTKAEGQRRGLGVPSQALQAGAQMRELDTARQTEQAAGAEARRMLGEAGAGLGDTAAATTLKLRQAEEALNLSKRSAEAAIRNKDAEAARDAAYREVESLKAAAVEARAKAEQERQGRLEAHGQATLAETTRHNRATEAAAAAAAAAKGRPDAGKLRGEFSRQVKPYVAQRDNFNRLMAAASDPSGANDIALIFNYMKMLDPASVVREGEFATAETAGRSVPQALIGLYNRALKGERLTPEQRAQIATSGRAQYESGAKASIDRLLNFYSGQATSGGLNPEDIVGGFDTPPAAAAAPPAAGKRLRFNPATGELE